MATLSANTLTLTDLAKRTDSSGRIPIIAELLSQSNEIMQDIPWMEGNQTTGHLVVTRTGLPDSFWRLLNQGLQPSKSDTAQITEGMGTLETWSETDKDLVELGGNPGAFRFSEAPAFTESMTQEFVQTLFFGNSSINPEEFNGLAPRYSDLSADIAQNILDAGGTGSDNSSIWLICWSPQTLFGIFPKGSQAGLIHEDLGIETAETTAAVGGQRMRVYRERWQWKAGLVVKDWRFAVRIANIDISNLVAKSSAADLIEEMIKAMHRIPNLNFGPCSFYMNRTTFQMLDIQRRDDVISGGGLVYMDVDGKMIPHFRGVPIRRIDQLIETEARVV